MAKILRCIDSKAFRVKIDSNGRAYYQTPLHEKLLPIQGLEGPVVDGSAGAQHYSLTGEDGSLYMCYKTVAKRIKTLFADKLWSASCGHKHTTAVFSNGCVFMNVEKKWLRISLPVKAVRCFSGYGVSAAIGEDSQLYTWGNNHWQQLGRAGNNDIGKVAIPGGVVDFGFGANFACALNTEGALYVWGWKRIARPQKMKALFPYSRLAVGAGFICAASQLHRDQVFMTGNVNGKLCHNVIQRQPFTVSCLRGGWCTNEVSAEFGFESEYEPAASQPLDLKEIRWLRRRLMLLCVEVEQKRKARRLPRACSDGLWSYKLPQDAWHAIISFL